MNLLSRACRICSDNLSIMLPILGASSAFIINLIMKSHLSGDEYGGFASALFLIAVLYMIAGLGFEQVLLRLATANSSGVTIDKSVALIATAVIFFSPVFSTLLLSALGVIDRVGIAVVISAFVVSISILLSTLYKMQGRLISHYLFLHAWKIILLLLVTTNAFVASDLFDYESLIYIALVSAFIISLLRSSFNNIEIKTVSSNYNLASYAFAGLTSIFGFAIFDGLDRFLIQSLFDKAIFGDYFFIFSFLMSPVGIVSGYYSAKKLNSYKRNFRFKEFKKDYLKVLIISFLIAFVFTVFLHVLVSLEIVVLTKNYHKILWVVFLLAVVRGGYAILSLAYSVLCSSKMLIIIGLGFTAISIALFYLVTILLKSDAGIQDVGVLVITVWILRSFVYYFLVKTNASAEGVN